jgi:hypothetical protein
MTRVENWERFHGRDTQARSDHLEDCDRGSRLRTFGLPVI